MYSFLVIFFQHRSWAEFTIRSFSPPHLPFTPHLPSWRVRSDLDLSPTIMSVESLTSSRCFQRLKTPSSCWGHCLVESFFQPLFSNLKLSATRGKPLYWRCIYFEFVLLGACLRHGRDRIRHIKKMEGKLTWAEEIWSTERLWDGYKLLDSYGYRRIKINKYEEYTRKCYGNRDCTDKKFWDGRDFEMSNKRSWQSKDKYKKNNELAEEIFPGNEFFFTTGKYGYWSWKESYDRPIFNFFGRYWLKKNR